MNALSEWLEVEIRRDGRVYTQRYDRGKPQSDLQAGEKTTKRGTTIRFKPDPEIFEITTFAFDILANRLRELAFLNKGLKIQLEDERDEKKVTFHYTGGIRQFVEHLNHNKTPVHPRVLYFEGGRGDIQVEVALQYNDGYQEFVFSFANNINTREGGYPPHGVPRGAHPHDQRLRAGQRVPQELQGRDHRRRRPRGADRRDLGAPAGAPVRGPDEGQARQQRRARPGRVGRQRQAGPGPSRRIPPPRGGSPRSACTPRRRARPPARRGSSPARRGSTATTCPGSWPTAPSAIPRPGSSSSSRGTRPAARRSRAATGGRRRSCRSAARSSTPRRRATTRCSRTRRSGC